MGASARPGLPSGAVVRLFGPTGWRAGPVPQLMANGRLPHQAAAHWGLVAVATMGRIGLVEHCEDPREVQTFKPGQPEFAYPSGLKIGYRLGPAGFPREMGL
jgi:hypothetical protein